MGNSDDSVSQSLSVPSATCCVCPMPQEALDRPADPRPAPTATGKIAKRVALAVVAMLVLLTVGVALIPDSTWKDLIVGMVSKTTGRKATVDGEVRVRLLRLEPDIEVEGFRLANADWVKDRPMLEVHRIEVRLSLPALLRLRLELPHVEIEGLNLDVERDAGSRVNWDFSTPNARKPAKNSKPARLPIVKQLIVRDGALTANDAIRKLRFHGGFSVSEQKKGTSAMTLHGSGKLNGKPFDLRVDGGSLFDIDTSKPYGFDAAISAADIKLDAHTEIPHPG
jgi:uncharacterized protein involved in outer membrane biogenesis